MGWRFHKSFKVLPGVRLNVGKKGISTSIGPKGAKVNIGPNGTRFTKCERKAPKFIYGDISSLKNNDSISLFFIVLYF